MKLKTAIIIGSAIGLIGCGSILGPQKKQDTLLYQLNDSNLNANSLLACSSNTAKDVSIYVSMPDTATPYNDYKMYYSTESYVVNSYAYSQWATNVSNMLHQSISQSLIASCKFRTINNSNVVTNDNYRLVTNVRMIRHEVNEAKNTYQAHLIITNQLIDVRNAKVVNTFIFDKVLASDGTPLGFVRSSSNLVAQYDASLIDWLNINTVTK